MNKQHFKSHIKNSFISGQNGAQQSEAHATKSKQSRKSISQYLHVTYLQLTKMVSNRFVVAQVLVDWAHKKSFIERWTYNVRNEREALTSQHN